VVRARQNLNGIAKAIAGPGATPQKIRETEAILVSANPQITHPNQLQPGQTVHISGTAVDTNARARLRQAEGADQARRAPFNDATHAKTVSTFERHVGQSLTDNFLMAPVEAGATIGKGSVAFQTGITPRASWK
jgi:hypothetical protein